MPSFEVIFLQHAHRYYYSFVASLTRMCSWTVTVTNSHCGLYCCYNNPLSRVSLIHRSCVNKLQTQQTSVSNDEARWCMMVMPAYTWLQVEHYEQLNSRVWLALLQNTSYYLVTYNFVGPSTMTYSPVESEPITDCVWALSPFHYKFTCWMVWSVKATRELHCNWAYLSMTDHTDSGARYFAIMLTWASRRPAQENGVLFY